ncbi:hypothetical protein POJ06DRAFT_211350 [Lipomyces tetrasporus]|uniref:Chitin biosynthesis protein n=1 Tax=Lipomyces tetrasporus TaxID=54092 RepID=A0AAD7QUM8_9ASCO|nr:uncharacterized protein POJ06DRAFT_211350 [Lipomyces tetrasporus]KAJ8100037.1 hypothetical protein POJ06DRAFT_211350 [Lipomyces tetrasporus]
MVEVSLTVGKLDASIAVLLTTDHHLIEFPSILLPPAVQAGSIVKINCSQDLDAEKKERDEFDDLQSKISELYGKRGPIRPQLRVRNATQTSIVLEWDPLDLATADLRSLSLFRNNTRLGRIPSPMTNTSTKLSGLSIDTAYTFHLELVTSAGTYVSDKVTVKTHKMTDLSGITVCVGIVSDEDRAVLEETVARIGAKPLQDRVRIDTTHFVCVEGREQQWERAMETNIPVVRPEWLRACESEGRIVGVRSYYLNADPKLQPPVRQNPTPKPNSTSRLAQIANSQVSPSQSPSTASRGLDRAALASPPSLVSPPKEPSPASNLKAAKEDETRELPGPVDHSKPDSVASVEQRTVPIADADEEIKEKVVPVEPEELVKPEQQTAFPARGADADVPEPEVIEGDSGDIGRSHVNEDGVEEITVHSQTETSNGVADNSSTDKFEDATSATDNENATATEVDKDFESVPL